MKTALPLIILALSVLGLQAQKPIEPIAKKKAKAEVRHAKCEKCSHAPCECGFSPSYYIANPNPARERAAAANAAKALAAKEAKAAKKKAAVKEKQEAKPAPKHPPLFTHWSRPRPQPAAPVELVKEDENAATPSESERIAEYIRRLEGYLAFYQGRELIGAAPARKLGFRFKRREPITPQTLIPSPRRAGALPTRNVTQSVGFVSGDDLVGSPRPANPLASVRPEVTLGFEPGLVGRNPFDRSPRMRPRRDGKPKYEGPPAFAGKPKYSGKPKFSGPPKYGARPPRGPRPPRGRRP